MSGARIANVSRVGVGDTIHLFFAVDGEYDYLGSYRSVDSAPNAATGALEALPGGGALATVASGSDLAQALATAGYKPDLKLGCFAGWCLEETAARSFTGIGSALRDLGNNALFAFDPSTAEIVTQTGRVPLGDATTALPTAGPRPTHAVSSGDQGSATEVSAPSRWSFPKDGRVIGLDWSGSKSAGKKIWQAHVNCRDGRAELERLDRPFADRPERGEVLTLFASWFARLDAAVLGCDFCFGLGHSQLAKVAAAASAALPPAVPPVLLGKLIATHFPRPEDLRSACSPEQKRETDRAVKAPFAPTNLRMFRQTWLGLRCLATLGEQAIAPWSTGPGCVVVEVLPARVARSLGVDGGYKGHSALAQHSRARLVDELGRVVVLGDDSRRTMILDPEGDAVDAVLAALAAAKAHCEQFPRPTKSVLNEGWIY